MGKLHKAFGARVQQLRKAAKLTQEELGKRTEMSGKVIGEIERGERNPTLGTIERLIKGLGIQPYEPFLFTLSERKSGGKVSDQMLLDMIRHTDERMKPFVVELVQTAISWAQRRNL